MLALDRQFFKSERTNCVFELARIAIKLTQRVLDRYFPHRGDGHINRSRRLNSPTDRARRALVAQRKPKKDAGIEQHSHDARLSTEKPSDHIIGQRVIKAGAQLQFAL